MLLYRLEFGWIELIKSVLPYIVISMGFLFFAIKYWKEKRIGFRVLSVLFVVISTALLFLFAFNFLGHISIYKEYNSVIVNRTYQTVSGPVENFKPADSNGKGEEVFSIDGVVFSYTYFEDYIGYHEVSTKGGVVTNNEQLLTINYIYDSELERNVILEIFKGEDG